MMLLTALQQARPSRKHPHTFRKTVIPLLICIAFLCIPLILQHVVKRNDDDLTFDHTSELRKAVLKKETGVAGTKTAPRPFDVWHRRLEETDSDRLSVVVSFEDILKTIIFLLTAWLFSVVFGLVGLPALVGEIVCGFVLGPPLLDFCPYPEAMVLIGNFGLIGLILESGVNLDIAQLKETGTRAVMLAVSGTVLAMSTGFGIASLSSSTDFRSAIAVGAVFAPSSLGVASQVLAKGEVLNTPTGQLIVAASVVDDVLGLILLSILEVKVMESPQVINYLLPFISSFGYLFVLGYLGITWIPRIIQKHVLPRFAQDNQEKVAFAMMFFFLAAYMPLLNYSGASYLTGAFLAGLSFSQIHFVHTAYERSGREIMVWLMRVFFAATIGFQVPIQNFADLNVLKWGVAFCKLMFLICIDADGHMSYLCLLFPLQWFLCLRSFRLVFLFLGFHMTCLKTFPTILTGEMCQSHPCRCFAVASLILSLLPLVSVLVCWILINMQRWCLLSL